MRNRIKILDDGRTVLYVAGSFTPYVLPEDDLENTLEKIKELENKNKHVFMLYYVFITLCFIVAFASLFYLSGIAYSISTIISCSAIILVLCVQLCLKPLCYKIYAPVIKDFKEVDLKSTKWVKLAFSFAAISLLGIFGLNILPAISEAFSLVSCSEYQKGNTEKAIEILNTAYKFDEQAPTKIIWPRISNDYKQGVSGEYYNLLKQKQIEDNQ